MSFRERPEYQDWRDAVFRLYGRECILCGHDGNIHAHHVKPVNTYPELAFEPTNGVPLCGNCHAEINGNELAYVDELERLQQAVLGGEQVSTTRNKLSELELRELAHTEPSNTEVVEHWFAMATDAQAVINFYNEHHPAFTKTAYLCESLAWHLRKLERWQDILKVTDRAILVAERDGTLARRVNDLAFLKSEALKKLGQISEAATFLREIVTHFPDVARLHRTLSVMLFDIFANHGQDNKALDESLQHIVEAVQLAPDDYQVLDWATFISMIKCDYASALRYGKQALALASTDEDKMSALRGIARIYMRNDFFSDARNYLREAMHIDDCNVDVIADMAQCYYMEGNERDAVRMAKRGLMLDLHNKACQHVYSCCGCPD